jgi:hypothetical protein
MHAEYWAREPKAMTYLENQDAKTKIILNSLKDADS